MHKLEEVKARRQTIRDIKYNYLNNQKQHIAFISIWEKNY